MLADHARAIQRVCFDSVPSESDLELLGTRERWLVYRDLVRTRLTNVIEAALPRTKAAIAQGSFERVIDEWLTAGGPKTRYFRHVPNELVDFAVPVWRDAEPGWLTDLARYEITAWSVRHAPPNPTPEVDFAFDRRPVVGSAVRVLHLDHPVQEGPTPEAGYAYEPVILCISRNDKHRAVTRTLNPLAADLLEAWQRSEETVAESVQHVAAAHGTAIGPAFVEKLSTLITTFIEQGIILGGRVAQ
jgi:hypothetical protein